MKSGIRRSFSVVISSFRPTLVVERGGEELKIIKKKIILIIIKSRNKY